MPNKSENPHLDIAPEVQAALQDGRAVVALESTIICHGMPHPKNVETARQVEHTVRDHGALPATIAILNGRLKVGLNESAINYLGSKGQQVIKTSRRDIPLVVARKDDGATTVAATMSIASMVGIRVFATGKFVADKFLFRSVGRFIALRCKFKLDSYFKFLIGRRVSFFYVADKFAHRVLRNACFKT